MTIATCSPAPWSSGASRSSRRFAGCSTHRVGGGLLLSGEPGIGKTLLWELGIREAREAGWRVLQHRSAQAEAGLSFAGLSDLLGGVFDEVADALVPPRRRALEVALLLAEPGDAPPDSRALGLAMLDVIRELSSRQPVCLALDDVQWLDASSAAVVSVAVRRLADEPVAVLATRRTQPGEPGGRTPFDARLKQLAVCPLDPPSIHRLLRNAVGRELPRAALAAIERASGGNPFFAVELARSAEWDAGEPHIHVPENLRELLSGRLDRLPAATQDVLLDAAALARPTVGLLAPDQARLAALDVAVLDRIVSVHRDEVRFAHPLLASLSYDRAPPGRLRAVHARLADLVDDPEERARHLAIAAGDAHDAQLASELDEASRRAAARGATAAAAELMELAIRHTAPEDRDASLARRIAAGRLHHQAGDIDRAADVYEALLDELPPGKLRAEVLYADALTQRPDVPHRIALCEEALASVGDDDVLATDVLGYLAINRWFGGDVVAGLENARAALSRAEGVGDPRLVATAIARVGWLEAARLDPTPGLLQRGVELERRLAGPSRFQDSPQFTLASHLWTHDGLETARGMLMEFATSAERRGDEVARGFSLMVLGSVERLAGRLELAVQLQETALLLAEQIAEPQLRLVASAFGARALLDVGRLDDAWQLAEDGMALTLAVKDVTHGAIAESVLGADRVRPRELGGGASPARRHPGATSAAGVAATSLCAVVGVDRGVRRPRRARSGGGTACPARCAGAPREPVGTLGRGSCARAARSGKGRRRWCDTSLDDGARGGGRHVSARTRPNSDGARRGASPRSPRSRRARGTRAGGRSAYRNRRDGVA